MFGLPKNKKSQFDKSLTGRLNAFISSAFNVADELYTVSNNERPIIVQMLLGEVLRASFMLKLYGETIGCDEFYEKSYDSILFLREVLREEGI